MDPARFKAADCSRRAGKTVGIAADLIDTARTYPDMACLYLTLSRLNAKRILWRDLLAINRDYGLGGRIHETELTLTFPNGHIIYLSGAKDKAEVEKFRGFPLKKVYIDEAQAFRAYLQDLVDDVLSKSLYDFNGSLALTGTPPPIPVGYFHDCVHGGEWSRHSWTMLQNPHLETKSGRKPIELILEDCKRMGVTIDHPKIQRECFGKWAYDSSSRVFKWEEKNHFDVLPAANNWEHIVGVDLGYADADAIAVIAWCGAHPGAYLVDEIVTPKQGITPLVGQLENMIKKYKPLSIVMDTGGLGKKIAEEMIIRYGLPIKAAAKQDKFAHIELVNDALRTSQLYTARDGAFAQDSRLVEWDRDKSSGDKLVVSDSFHSDICDAVLYAFREAQHWIKHPQKIKVPANQSPEWIQAEIERMEAAAIASLQLMQQREATVDDNWEDWEDWK